VAPLTYVDFDLRIEREGTRYTARVLDSPAGEASSTFILPFTEDRVENLILKIGRRLGGAGVRRIHSDEMDAARELGGSLFDALFTGGVRDCYTRSLDSVIRSEGAGLRLRLRLQDVPELADLPWEFLLDKGGGRFLAQSAQTPVIRYMEMPQGVRPFSTALPLRVLVMISAPIDVPQLDLVKERKRLEAALQPLHDQGKVYVTWQEDATLTALMRYLRKETYHIFHFVGHGAFDDKREVGLLLLEDEQERSFPVESDRIGAFLHDHSSLRLAVLNSCEGARSSRNDPFAGVAANLVRQGIPAVVAMQFEISDDAAITFSGEFYAALAEGFPVDAAVAEARKAIYATNDVEWATPVLYMRSESGLLFKLEEPARRDSTADRQAALAAKRVSDQAALRARQAERDRERQRQSLPPPGVQRAKQRVNPDNSLHKVFMWSGAIVLGLFVLLIGIGSLIGDHTTITPVTLSITPVTKDLFVDETASLSATVTNSDGSTATANPTWTSSDDKVATVSYSGVVTAVSAGTVDITAYDGGLSAQARISVYDNVAPQGGVGGSGYAIPALRANVTALRFFEGPYDAPPRAQRVYARRFSQSSARYIWAQLEISFPRPGQVLEAPVNCIYNHQGDEWGRAEMNIVIQPEWESAYTPAGYGWRDAGHWPRGTFRVQCIADGSVITEASFEVY
jgi:hypothetical protein